MIGNFTLNFKNTLLFEYIIKSRKKHRKVAPYLPQILFTYQVSSPYTHSHKPNHNCSPLPTYIVAIPFTNSFIHL